ncbi:hypothetical protein JL722_6058 [Aureococcus anophagefferens]|nr:hypothetical protein JL722_6058 [Aureococcus anophagefferens]
MKLPILLAAVARADDFASDLEDFARPGAGGHLGKSTYAMSHPFAFKGFMEQYFPTAEQLVRENSTKQCVEWAKLCIDDGSSSANVCKSKSAAQLHSVGAYKRDSGSKSMEDIEADFTAAMGDLSAHDPYFETHAAFLTKDLDYYAAVFGNASVPTHHATFAEGDKSYDSLLLQTYNGAMTKGDAAEFRYVQSAKATRGPTTVAAWERYQTSLHKTCFKSAQNVGFDRLADNHIGHSENGKALDTFIHAQKASGLPYRIYGPPGKGSPPWFFYGYMPNGWGYQLTGQCTDKSLCPKSPFYDMCTQGVLPDCTAA